MSESGDEGGRNQSFMTDPLNVSQGFQSSVGACKLNDFGEVTVSLQNGINIIYVYIHSSCFQVRQGTREDSSPSDLSTEDAHGKMVRLCYVIVIIHIHTSNIFFFFLVLCHIFSLSGHIG